MTTREFDIVLWGATGFTGSLVAEYLVAHRLGTIKLALAGRDRGKLEQVRAELARRHAGAAELPLLLGDSHDRASLDAIASRTKVVCSTVGPYAKYGEPLVAACAAAGTHYCDLTGEPQFVHEMIARHHAAAQASGARIVHCCGYDSVPSDLGVFMLHRAFMDCGGQLQRAHTVVGKVKGGVSGGTIASALLVAEQARRDASVRKVVMDPYALYPQGEAAGPDEPDALGVHRDADLDQWTAPFVMAGINGKVVRRSNALLGFAYGREFRYSEVMGTGAGVGAAIRAAVVSVGTVVMLPMMAVGPTRKLLQRLLPAPGEGPDRATREAGFFVMHLIGDGVDQHGASMQLRGRVEGTSDPGYGETAKMLAESALCLACDPLDSPGGVCTPASSMGEALLERLRAAGMTFAWSPT